MGSLETYAGRNELKIRFNVEFAEEGKFARLLLSGGSTNGCTCENFRCWSSFGFNLQMLKPLYWRNCGKNRVCKRTDG